MSTILQTASPSDGREPPVLPKFETSDGEWQLCLDCYRTFIEDVTGIEASDELSTRELKTIQSRLEGCVETYKRDGDCLCDGFENYEHLDSMEDVHELTRFFRTLVASRIEGTELTQ